MAWSTKTAGAHDVNNLYLIGGNVFPTVSWANPTFTLMALTYIGWSITCEHGFIRKCQSTPVTLRKARRMNPRLCTSSPSPHTIWRRQSSFYDDLLGFPRVADIQNQVQ